MIIEKREEKYIYKRVRVRALNTKTGAVRWGSNKHSGMNNGKKMSEIVCGIMAHLLK